MCLALDELLSLGLERGPAGDQLIRLSLHAGYGSLQLRHLPRSDPPQFSGTLFYE